jgi:hypothetical protein
LIPYSLKNKMDSKEEIFMKKVLIIGFIFFLISLTLVTPVLADPYVLPIVLSGGQVCADVQLSWTSCPGVASYALFRSENNVNSYQVGGTANNILTFTDPDVAVGPHYYQVLPIKDGDWFYPCISNNLPVTVTVSTCPPISTPEFPSLFLPATLIIGFLGAVLLIQRTREH